MKHIFHLLLVVILLLMAPSNIPVHADDIDEYSIFVYSEDGDITQLSKFSFGDLEYLTQYDDIVFRDPDIFYLSNGPAENIVNYNLETSEIKFTDGLQLGYDDFADPYILPNGTLRFIHGIQGSDLSIDLEIYNEEGVIITTLSEKSEVFNSLDADKVAMGAAADIYQENQWLLIWYEMINEHEYGTTEYIWFNKNTLEFSHFIANEPFSYVSEPYHIFDNTLYAIQTDLGGDWEIFQLKDQEWDQIEIIQRSQSEDSGKEPVNYLIRGYRDAIIGVDRLLKDDNGKLYDYFNIHIYNITTDTTQSIPSNLFENQLCDYWDIGYENDMFMNRTLSIELLDYHSRKPVSVEIDTSLLVEFDQYIVEISENGESVNKLPYIDTCSNYRVNSYPISPSEQFVIQRTMKYDKIGNNNRIISYYGLSAVLILPILLRSFKRAHRPNTKIT